jgi:hypothetical protein
METPETRAKLANAIQTLRSQGRESEVLGLVNAYKAKYKAPAQETTVAGGGNVPVVKQLSDVGVGIGSTIGKTVLGAVQAPLRISSALGRAVGADTQYVDKAVLGIEKAKQAVYQKPFEQQLSTASGKVGQAIGTVAPYLATAGAVNPLTANLGTIPRVLARAGADVAVSQAQSGGDLKTGLATGVSSGVADAVLGGKAKAVRGILPTLKNIGKTTSTGYVSDVASGMAGMRGEDRTGAKAFIPGAGTVLAGALGTAQAGVQGYKNIKNPDAQTINKAKAELEDSYIKFYGGTQAGKKKIDKALFATEMKDKAGTSGLAPHKILAQDAIIPEIKGNQFDTFEQARQYKEQTLNVAKQSKRILKEVELQTPKVRLSDLEAEAMQRANTQQNIDSGDAEDLIKNIRREFAKLRKTYGNEIPLSKVDDIKSARWSKIDFSKQNPFAPRVDKLSSDADYLIAKTAQKKIEDVATQAGLEDVAQFNRDIGDRLEASRFLADLNGKTLKGSFTTRMASRIIGASAGTSLPGSVIGAIGGDYVANLLISNSVANPTKRLILSNIQAKSPESYSKVMEWLTKQGLDRELRLALPGASAIYVPPTKKTPTSEMVVTGGKLPPANFAQAQKRATGLPEYGGLYEYNQAKIATDKAVGRSVLPKPNANKGTSVKRSPSVPERFKVEDVSQYSLPSNTRIAEPIKTPKSIVISKSITVPKGSSIDQTRAIVNNHLTTTLQAIADPDTFDVISANPQAFYKQQIKDIAMGLKAENPKYARLANSISSIDATKIDSFETLANKIREKLNARTLMETLTGKGLPNRQGGFIKNPLASVDDTLIQEAKKYKSAEEFVNDYGDKLYHGGSKINEVGNMRSPWKAFYMSDNKDYANSYGGSKSVINEMVLTKKAKIADMRKPNERLVAQIENIIKPKETGDFVKIQKPDGSIIEVPKTKGGKSSGVFTVKDIIQGIKDGKALYAEMPEVKEALKKLGYDGQITTESKYGSNYGIWNKDVIKTKSQLTDIWNKANKSVLPKAKK